MDRDQGASRREDSRVESRGSSQGAVLMIPPEKAVRFEIIRKREADTLASEFE
ncbi:MULTISPECIES: hypothetical protein [unclassified Bradyrhizobium]|uniref:hypothetical protein n=1 Tax=unclassified Bradyrhizobium TaxID=2631580 RepID=UPI0012F7E828|nr:MULTISPECIES: hypothetical protein [unclassified Bradyrhizobium]MCK1352311.1 hypothetical protein [Bradyrhizobium sp. CW7]MCK1412758.1 hypothetical protein [Bradyrhizobium sp. CW4]MCK1426280.1 hypothetical protein [Bradyrhizobium sp. 87]MCK1577275.1 hypothetical protein [Bradyrhizobium sp. 174]MCK1709376.1 hypothetical protein [Bradyrhizobium sp. 143]